MQPARKTPKQPNSCSFALFDTRIGRCAIAWSERGVVLLQLPEASAERTRARVLARVPDASERPPAAAVGEIIALIESLLRGEPASLERVPLDMDHLPPFQRRVYEAARAIPPGATLSYGALAARMGSAGAARAVGQALGKNPFAIIVPCHRVLAAGGKLGGFSAEGGTRTKARLLAIESACAAGGGHEKARAARPRSSAP